MAKGITVNALVIETEPGALRGPGGTPLIEHYECDVIGGAGAFVAVARDRERFSQAILKKLVLEIAETPKLAWKTSRRRANNTLI